MLVTRLDSYLSPIHFVWVSCNERSGLRIWLSGSLEKRKW